MPMFPYEISRQLRQLQIKYISVKRCDRIKKEQTSKLE